MKIFSKYLIFLILVLFALFGCSKDCPPVLQSAKIQTIEKKVVIGCPVPEPKCDFSGTGLDPIKKLLQCISIQKKIIEACRIHSDRINEISKSKTDTK